MRIGFWARQRLILGLTKAVLASKDGAASHQGQVHPAAVSHYLCLASPSLI